MYPLSPPDIEARSKTTFAVRNFSAGVFEQNVTPTTTGLLRDRVGQLAAIQKLDERFVSAVPRIDVLRHNAGLETGGNADIGIRVL